MNSGQQLTIILLYVLISDKNQIKNIAVSLM